MLLRFITIIFVAAAFSAEAEIFSWIDENGKQHFGDKIPPDYQNQATSIRPDIHTPNEKDVQDRITAHNNSKKFTRNVEKKRKNEKRQNQIAERQRKLQSALRNSASDQNTSPQTPYGGDYEQKLAEYNSSVMCFNSCRIEIPQYSSYTDASGNYIRHKTGSRYDMSNCGHCKELPKPKK